jgi:hypothetical protein
LLRQQAQRGLGQNLAAAHDAVCAAIPGEIMADTAQRVQVCGIGPIKCRTAGAGI